jgi:enamine deaminase RidA (YjgF/YER057c/UK114 family)
VRADRSHAADPRWHDRAPERPHQGASRRARGDFPAGFAGSGVRHHRDVDVEPHHGHGAWRPALRRHPDGKVVGVEDFEAQCKQVFANIEAALRSVGATWSNVVHFTNYLIDRDDQPRFVKYRLGFFPQIFPNGYPPNTILFVDKLLRKEFLVEVQAIAAL